MTTSPPNYDIEVFYDGECPLCLREIEMLRRWDRGGRIRFTDFTAEGFSLADVGVDYPTLMARIHGRLPDGTLVTGVEVFRRLYAAVGFKWPVALSRLPVVRQLLDLAYLVFAKNRLRLAGRCTKETCGVEHGTSSATTSPES